MTNPSDLVSQASNSTLRLRFRIKSDLPSVVSAAVSNKAATNNGWDAILWQGRLYIHVDPTQITNAGSKGTFMSLLEYAEEVLECSHVIVCIDNQQSNNATKMAIRNFLFLGLQQLAPGHEYLPSNPNVVCFLYTI